MLHSGLSIGIPTYNRKDALVRLLKSIECQQYNLLDEIIIGDNASPYDVEAVILECVSPALFSKCRLIKNNFNIGGPANIKNQFLNCNSKWFWLIGDDDEITEDALDIILKDIEAEPECAYFKYSTRMNDGIIGEDDVRFDNLHQFIEYSRKRYPGNLVFMSNNIYNMEKLAPYLPVMMTYNTSVPQCISMMVGLDREEIYVRFSSKPICIYNMPEGGVSWNMLRVALALSCLQEIPFKSLRNIEWDGLLSAFRLMPFRLVVGWCVRNKEKVGHYRLIRRAYNGLYSSPFRIFDYILLLLCKLEFLYNIPLLTKIYSMKKDHYVEKKN